MVNSLLSNELKELAAGYILGDLDAAEKVRVERLMAENPELRREVQEMQSVMGIMASNVSQMEPPADLLDKILDAVVTD